MTRRFRFSIEEANDLLVDIRAGRFYSCSPAIKREILELQRLGPQYPFRTRTEKLRTQREELESVVFAQRVSESRKNSGLIIIREPGGSKHQGWRAVHKYLRSGEGC